VPRRDLPFPCAVVRHRGARRMSLRVSRAGVRLTVPPGVSAAEMDAFLRASTGWVALQQDRLGPPPPPLADGDRLALLDEELRLAVAPARRASVRREGPRLVAAVPPGADLDAAVERWYRRAAADALGARSRALAAALGVRVAAVAIRDPRSRWGSCAAAAGRLSYSWRLMLAPAAVADYVVAHEVCHLVLPDHSPGYWELVARVAPGSGESRAWLRRNGERLHLGPGWRGISPA
jgi:predicted metal-dependent hydrolase